MKCEIKTLGELSIEGKGSYGIAASAVEYSPDLYTYLRITDINDDGTIKKDGLKSVADDRAEEYLLQPNDIVFARTGASTGRNYFYDGSDGEFVYAGFLIKFSIDTQKVNPYYIKYFCQSDIYKQWVQSFNTGSTRGNINAKIYSDMQIPLPPRKQQDFLVSILKPIDDKIAANKEINKNLEGQAQALYDNLFANVSFDVTLADIGTVVGGSTPSKKHPEYYTDQGIAWITPKDLSNDSSKFIYHGENDITELGLSKCSATVMPIGTVLFSSRAPIGYIAVAANPVATNQGFKSVIPNKDIGTAFIYYFLKNNLTLIESMASGSTFKEISASVMKNVPAFIPIKDKLNIFRDFCNPLFTYQQKLEMENNRLSNLRNTLLPRIMSGEIDVSNVEL